MIKIQALERLHCTTLYYKFGRTWNSRVFRKMPNTYVSRMTD